MSWMADKYYDECFTVATSLQCGCRGLTFNNNTWGINNPYKSMSMNKHQKCDSLKWELVKFQNQQKKNKKN